MPTVPNLFRDQDAREAKRLYSLYLSRLMAKSRQRRIVEACQQIRNYAARLKQPRSADFTFQFEIDALCKLRRFADAWKQLRRLPQLDISNRERIMSKRMALYWIAVALLCAAAYLPYIWLRLIHYRSSL